MQSIQIMVYNFGKDMYFWWSHVPYPSHSLL